MFPIHSMSGRVMGLGDESLQDKQSAKYVNSPEIEVYQKSKVLYGLSGKTAYRQAKQLLSCRGVYGCDSNASADSNVVSLLGLH